VTVLHIGLPAAAAVILAATFYLWVANGPAIILDLSSVVCV
jgi:hypothetical protein